MKRIFALLQYIMRPAIAICLACLLVGPLLAAESAGEMKLQKARVALTGEQKNTVQAKKLLLEIVEKNKDTLDSQSLCYVYVYLGYIEDRAGNRNEAVAWYKKALEIKDADRVQECATFGLEKPLTWIRHLDENATPPPRQQNSPAEAKLQQARDALHGEPKNADLAKKLLLEILEHDKNTLASPSLCYVYVYLGYIEDRAGNRNEAVAWYKKALEIKDADMVRGCATSGLEKPLTWIRHLDEGTEKISLESAPPVVVRTVPMAGGAGVDPALTEIRATYSKPMQDGSWSWSIWNEENYPETIGKPRYLSDGCTCVLPVNLKPDKFYAIWLNTDGFQNFKDQQGHPAVPYLLTFCTGAVEKEKPEKPSASVPKTEPAGPNRPNVVSVSPADGATNVDTKQELRLRFDQPMNPNVMGINWSSGGFVPDGQPRYEPARNEFVVPVRLVPGQTNELMAQSSSTGSGGFRTTNLTCAGDYRWHFTTKPVVVKPGAVKPNVIRISPASGETLPVLTLLEITFDQPMMPPDQGFPYLRKTGSSFDLPAQIPAFDYDPSSHRFTVPVVLPPDNDTKLMLDGFYSADGVASDPIVIRCQIGTNSYSSEQLNLIATAAKDPRLEQLVSSMKAARARLNSGTETVQWTRFFGGKESFKWIMANSATFKWQGTNQIYADISEIMNLKAFILGNDGKTCWLYADDPNGRRLDSSPAALVPDIYTSVADPFTLTKFTVAEAIAKGRLVYQDQTQFEGRACHRVQSWMVRQPQNENDRVFAAKLEWWIDAETLLPVQVIENSQYSSETFRFHYEQLNQPLPDAAFQPPAMTGINAKKDGFKLFKQEIPLPNEKRFLTIKDGGNGEMSGRLGWSSPGGTTSSGLN